MFLILLYYIKEINIIVYPKFLYVKYYNYSVTIIVTKL